MTQLTCPGCGAAAAPEATICTFCRSPLVRVACPSCFQSLFQGMRFCPHCGTKALRDEGSPARAIHCPGCQSDMHPVQVGTIEMHECASCASAWVSTETFVALTTREEARGEVAAMIGRTPARPAAPAGPVRYRKCPICTKVMNRMNFARRSGVILDVCRGHGVWFESRELGQVLEFIAAGGLERAREAEREARRLEEISERIRREDRAPED